MSLDEGASRSSAIAPPKPKGAGKAQKRVRVGPSLMTSARKKRKDAAENNIHHAWGFGEAIVGRGNENMWTWKVQKYQIYDKCEIIKIYLSENKCWNDDTEL